jgi:hypothetical protein
MHYRQNANIMEILINPQGTKQIHINHARTSEAKDCNQNENLQRPLIDIRLLE